MLALPNSRRFDETWLAGCNQLVVVHAKRRHSFLSAFINFLEFGNASILSERISYLLLCHTEWQTDGIPYVCCEWLGKFYCGIVFCLISIAFSLWDGNIGYFCAWSTKCESVETERLIVLEENVCFASLYIKTIASCGQLVDGIWNISAFGEGCIITSLIVYWLLWLASLIHEEERAAGCLSYIYVECTILGRFKLIVSTAAWDICYAWNCRGCLCRIESFAILIGRNLSATRCELTVAVECYQFLCSSKRSKYPMPRYLL